MDLEIDTSLHVRRDKGATDWASYNVVVLFFCCDLYPELDGLKPPSRSLSPAIFSLKIWNAIAEEIPSRTRFNIPLLLAKSNEKYARRIKPRV